MDIKVPEVGESIHEATVARWHRNDGDTVRKNDLLCELETDKITLELNADADGVLSIAVKEGETVPVGTLLGRIAEEKGAFQEKKAEKEEPQPEQKARPEEKGAPQPSSHPLREVPMHRELVEEEKEPQPPRREERPAPLREGTQRESRRPMTAIRRRIAERLVAARQGTAMLTTFNEADLGRVQELRGRHQENFRKRHGVSLGLMSFFVKAVVEGLRDFPDVHSRIEGEEIVTPHVYDIGIAVGAERGLVVPVLRDADRLHFAGIERAIRELVEKVEANRLALSDLEGGSFTITNGGVYGSLLSTPILNPPQSGVLGMHAIQERPVVRDGQIVARPMMYLALSYDHRLVDGRQAVSFLKRVKEVIEAPEEMLLDL